MLLSKTICTPPHPEDARGKVRTAFVTSFGEIYTGENLRFPFGLHGGLQAAGAGWTLVLESC